MIIGSTGVAANGRPGLHTALPQCPLPPPFLSPGLSTSSVFITAGKNPSPILSHIKHPNQNNQHQKCQCWVQEEGEDEDEDEDEDGRNLCGAMPSFQDRALERPKTIKSPNLQSPIPQQKLTHLARRGESPSSPPLQDSSFLKKLKLGLDKSKREEPQEVLESPQPPEEADQIFKKMKETGLIPNAVAMLDGLFKDGLVQEAMKLFGSMREKGTIPEVVIYTAVVDGFCKAQKFEDAKRIFRKMHSNGIVPNAFSYTVLIQGLYRASNLEDAAEFCSEMLEAGHSPNVATFVGLIDAVCKEKDMEEAESVIGKLKQKGYMVNEKAVKEFLDKKAPFSPRVWEAIFGKNKSQRMF
ncbi:hypothetical protein C1H46_000462 [Malus baccata]|uniref:Pentacotripeptide-repeat region of PRORP domain-containing protein n=1 Tax=Malus baccata TaxID=106549 RepID=A0A540NS26_MALBA|nr:hypothetical protein C1H46_000462 [Malus baccata]